MNSVCSSSRNSRHVAPNSHSHLIFHRVVQIACSRFRSNQLLAAPHRSPLILPPSIASRLEPAQQIYTPASASPLRSSRISLPTRRISSQRPSSFMHSPRPLASPSAAPPSSPSNAAAGDLPASTRCSAPPKRLLLHALRCPNQRLHDQYLTSTLCVFSFFNWICDYLLLNS
jgi:hypothetical protein